MFILVSKLWSTVCTVRLSNSRVLVTSPARTQSLHYYTTCWSLSSQCNTKPGTEGNSKVVTHKDIWILSLYVGIKPRRGN
jgi:hypothetical protein